MNKRNQSYHSEGPKGRNRKERCSGLNDPASRARPAGGRQLSAGVTGRAEPGPRPSRIQARNIRARSAGDVSEVPWAGGPGRKSLGL